MGSRELLSDLFESVFSFRRWKSLCWSKSLSLIDRRIHRFHVFDWDNTASHKPFWGPRIHRARGFGSKACLLAESGWAVVQVHSIFTMNLRASSHPIQCYQWGKVRIQHSGPAMRRFLTSKFWEKQNQVKTMEVREEKSLEFGFAHPLSSATQVIQTDKKVAVGVFPVVRSWFELDSGWKKVVETIALANCISFARLVHCCDGRRDAHKTPKLCEICEIPASFE